MSEAATVTFSIVAHDPDAGEIGVAVQSHFFNVGSLCPWAEAGVGAVATQAFVEPGYGPRGLALMRSGLDPRAALDALLAVDPGQAVRQVAMLDATGRVATHTGDQCIAACGHRSGDGVSVQGNMLSNNAVWSSMLDAYEKAKGGGLALAERLLAALDAAEANGGDVRGRQSAAMLVVSAASPVGRSVGMPACDLRVDDDVVPLAELRRLLGMHRATALLLEAEGMVLDGRADEAIERFAAAQDAFGPNLEPSFWAGAMLAAVDRVDDAVPYLRAAAASRPAWLDLLKRLPTSGALPLTTEQVSAVMARIAATER